MHTTHVSDEPLDVIFAAECGASNDITTKRFNRLQNEIEFLHKQLNETIKLADRESDLIMGRAERAHDEENYDLYEELESQAVVCSMIADKLRFLVQQRG